MSQRSGSEKPKKTNGKGDEPIRKSKKPWGEWGGFEGEFGGQLGAFLLIHFLPFIPFLYYAACKQYECSVTVPLLEVFQGKWTPMRLYEALPVTTWKHWAIYLGWILFQALLMLLLPGKHAKGMPTPTGNILPYKINALLACIISMTTFCVASLYFKLFPMTIIYDEYGGLLVVSTILGIVGAYLAYLKGRLYPTNSDTTVHHKFWYDVWMGVELNPRIGFFDIKIFMIGRLGMFGWGMMLLSLAAKQYQYLGYLTNSMILVFVFELIYILDWAWKEEWYLATLDIMHDHFGWFLSYGSTCWVATSYTTQAWYLVHQPVVLSVPAVGAVIFVQVLGYTLFRLTNNQKLSFRAANGKINIWGKPAQYVEAKYTTTDGKERRNLLLASGFWGLARHFNYLTDLLITASFCMCCGFDHLLPWTYQIWMTSLLVDRAFRDDRRCKAKYGKAWDEYKAKVPYLIIPYVF